MALQWWEFLAEGAEDIRKERGAFSYGFTTVKCGHADTKDTSRAKWKKYEEVR